MRWGRYGTLLATASHDKTVNLYHVVRDGSGGHDAGSATTLTASTTIAAAATTTAEAVLGEEDGVEPGDKALEKLATFGFAQTPECVAFVIAQGSDSDAYHDSGDVRATNGGDHGVHSQSEGEDEELVVALRDVCYLVYINCRTLEQRRVSLNEHAWDTHTSFTPLYLTVMPTQTPPPEQRQHSVAEARGNNLPAGTSTRLSAPQYLLVCTDNGTCHYVYRVGSHERVQRLAGGHSGDAYSRPCAAWSPCGRYAYCSGGEGGGVCVYSVATGDHVKTLRSSNFNSDRRAVRTLAVCSASHDDGTSTSTGGGSSDTGLMGEQRGEASSTVGTAGDEVAAALSSSPSMLITSAGDGRQLQVWSTKA